VHLCVYSDTVHGDAAAGARTARGALLSDYPFLVYIAEVARHFDATSVLGRYEPRVGPEFVPMPDGVTLLPLPSYGNLGSLREVLRAALGTWRAFWRAAGSADVIWCFGPHPFAVLLALAARLRRTRIVFGVRIDPIEYYAARRASAPGWQQPAVRALGWAFRRAVGDGRVATVGAALAAQYPKAQVHDMRISLTRDSEIVPPRAPHGRPVELLTVGRIAPEKNPHLLLDAVARLVADGVDVRLTWIGTGELRDDVHARVEQLGLGERISLLGHVPFGAPLLDEYHSADAFVHVALTEGVPQVIYEAFAAGLPVVATDVGGVHDACADGAAAVLVPPADLDALVSAIRTIVESPELALRIARAGSELARANSLERSAGAAAAFVRG
jgi:glycosyltransferase involved in cell wall biosynthesis